MALVMIVDDDQQILKLLSEIIQKEGHQVVATEDGEQAFQQFQKQHIDLVITDLLMPNKEGLELIQELRGIRPELKIIAYSGGGKMQPDNYLDFAKGMGADRVFSKPIPIKQLTTAVADLLSELK